MSKERMNDVHEALKASGWRLLHVERKFDVENELVTWSLEHSDMRRRIDIDFILFGNFGARTDDIKDILLCVVRGRNVKLCFEKRSKPIWQEALSDFVEQVQCDD